MIFGKIREHRRAVALIHHEKLAKLPLEEAVRELRTDPEKGLTQAEADKRLQDYGYNEIPEKTEPAIVKFLKKFWGPIPWMIEAAAILSFIVKDWNDFWIILTLLTVNAVIEFWQEHKAENIIAYLKKKMAVYARVLRDMQWTKIPARELVPGDIVRLRIGDIVPADVRILDDTELQVDESALTGESLPAKKKKGDVVYSGSVIKRGEAKAVVIGTGLNTYFGKTVQLVNAAKTQSELQKMVIKIGDFLIGAAVVLTTTIFIVGVFVQHHSWISMLKYALVLTVASIPAALPAVLSITMAIGAMELARKKAIVTKLVAIEELAGVDILCSDKTGTLTKNQLTVEEVIPVGKWKEEDVVFYAALASKEEDKDPIDLAVLNKAEAFGLDMKIGKWKQEKFIPFDPTIKRTEAYVTDGKNKMHVLKGAPQVILSLANPPEDVKKFVEEKVHELAEKGFRTIAVAVDKGKGIEFVGLIPLYDPPRDDAKQAVSLIQKLGVKVKMVTGDHIAIAKYIAKILGIGEKARTMDEISKLPGSKKVEAIEQTDVFAQVLPEHKYEIVSALQEKGHMVAMTGDGVNDAPALKKAHCGIAVAGATDAARAAASIVLLEPGISVIADALRTARRIFQRMESYVLYRITETIRVLIFMALSILVFGFYPITATMIILLALLNDIPILMIAYDNVEEPKKPAKWQPKKISWLSLAIGVAGVVSSFMALAIALWWYGAAHGMSLMQVVHAIANAGAGDKAGLAALAFIQTFIFLKLIIAGHTTIFVTRSKGWFWQKPWPSKPLFWGVMITNLIGTVMAVYGWLMPTAIGWGPAIFIWIYANLWMILNDAVKQWIGKKLGVDVEEANT
ncbi:MAG: plasma-membrane proton-efflux P-type ATPase [Candidatus Diapherotrites archaeon]|nr:plasma-membrane proton-efflux P-type ATPase [Candidatus Diapherotrites archaeon]